MSNKWYQSISLLSKCFKIQNNTEYSINISTLLHKFYSYWRDFMCGILTKQCPMKTWVPAASNHSSPLCVSACTAWWLTQLTIMCLWYTVQTHKSLWCQLNSGGLPVSEGVDGSLSWFLHLICRSQYRTTDLNLSCTLTQWHYTMGSGSGE